jgi:hypothetical protein
LNSAAAKDTDVVWIAQAENRSTSVADDGENGFWTLSHAIWNSCSILTYLDAS